MEKHVMSCGCSFNKIGTKDGKFIIDIPVETIYEDLNLSCPRVAELLASGESKGVFQLESPLGRSWVKKLKPENLEHMAALVALLRPGCLEAKDEKGVSMTEHYARRKNNLEPAGSYHPIIDKILAPTYNVIAYQEQAILIAAAVAGFNLQQADNLRKAMGKKLPEEMAKVKIDFIEGCKKVGILTDEQAAEVFGWIEKSQRYSFNKSHAVCYGDIGFVTAYLKSHFTVEFFTSWLFFAVNKGDAYGEMRDLIEDSKLFDMKVLPPNLIMLEPNFVTDREKSIWFGLGDIKGIGDSQIKKLVDATRKAETLLSKKFCEMTWFEALKYVLSELNTAAVEKFIQSGACDSLSKMSRKEMLAEWDAWNRLTAKEQEFILVKIPRAQSLSDALGECGKTKKEGGGAANKNRVEIIQSTKILLDNPPARLFDDPMWVVWHESNLLGTPLTASVLDDKDADLVANCTCKEIHQGKRGPLVVAAEIKAFREFKIKNGKNIGRKMGFLSIGDSTCTIDSVVMWCEAYDQYADLCTEGNTVIIFGEADKKTGSLVVKKIVQI